MTTRDGAGVADRQTRTRDSRPAASRGSAETARSAETAKTAKATEARHRADAAGGGRPAVATVATFHPVSAPTAVATIGAATA